MFVRTGAAQLKQRKRSDFGGVNQFFVTDRSSGYRLKVINMTPAHTSLLPMQKLASVAALKCDPAMAGQFSLKKTQATNSRLWFQPEIGCKERGGFPWH
jgi:hypothetical protein